MIGGTVTNNNESNDATAIGDVSRKERGDGALVALNGRAC